MAGNKLPKKGPHRVATAPKPNFEDDDPELDATIKGLAEKAHNIIQKARSKMTPEEREQADRNANAILEDATASAKRAQRRA
jgi:hypothetical protein